MRRDQRDPEPAKPRGKPAITPEGRENQLIAMATDLAEKQLRDGTASAQVIQHFLKLGSTREVLEQKRLMAENALMDAKRENLISAQKVEELIGNALDAMRSYSGGQVFRAGEDPED